MIGKSINQKGLAKKTFVKLCACLMVIAYIAQMIGMFAEKSVTPAEAKESVEKFYTFGSGECLSYLKWKGTTESVKANPKSKSNKNVDTAFDKETMGFCLNRKGNPPSSSGVEAKYSRELTKKEFSPIYYAYYSGNKYDVSGKKLWYATQVAIWCMLGQISSVRAKGLAQTESLAYNGSHNDVLKTVKALVKDSEENPVKPFVQGSEKIRFFGVPEFKVDSDGSTVTITGLSTNVKGCKVAITDGTAKNSKVTVNGKDIIITADYDADTQLKFTLEASNSYAQYSGKAYYLGGNYQNVGYVGDSISETVSAKKTVNFKAQTQSGSITIKKHPYIQGQKSDVGLSGAIFEIKSDSLEDGEIIEVITDDEGIAKVNNLPFGKYEITEVQAPEGYSMKNEKGETNSISVELSATNTEYVYECYNSEFLTGYISIYKADADDITKRLTGAKFVCRSVSGDFEEIVPEHHTVKGFYALEIPYGDYVLTEEKSPNGYVLDEENSQWYFTLDETCVNSTVNILIENYLPKGGVNIIKTDAQTGAALEGAEFSLYCKNDIEINGRIRCKAGEKIATQHTDGDGLAVFDELYYGDYYIVETKAPSNYLLSENNKYEFTIGENSTDVTIEVENTAESTPAPIPTPTVPTTNSPSATPQSTEKVVLHNVITPIPDKETVKPAIIPVVEKEVPKATLSATKVNIPADSPKTGDDTMIGIWLVSAIAALAVIIGICCKSVKE